MDYEAFSQNSQEIAIFQFIFLEIFLKKVFEIWGSKVDLERVCSGFRAFEKNRRQICALGILTQNFIYKS